VVRVATLAAATLATLTTLTTLGTFTLAACVAGCERNGPPTRGSAESSSRTDAADAAPRSPAAVAALERALALDAGALGNLGALGHGADLADPAALAGAAGNLRAEVDQFKTLDDCVAEHAPRDAVVRDALEAVGYDTFVRDACRVLEAARSSDARRCDGIDASSLRLHCRATVAELAADPDACPWQDPADRQRGRDAACVAVAARSPRLCAGVDGDLARARCVAVARADARACDVLPSPADRARCVRAAERWHDVLASAGDRGSEPAMPAPSGRLEVSAAGGAVTIGDLASEVAHGVVVSEELGGVRLVVGSPGEPGAGFVAASPHVAPTLAFELVLPRAGSGGGDGGGAGAARVERAELVLPGHLPMPAPYGSSKLHATVSTLARERGGPAAVSIRGQIDGEGATWNVHADVSTFVRDVVRGRLADLPAAAGPASTGSAAAARGR